MSRRGVSGIFGVSENTVSAWMKRGMPRNDDGTYDTALVYQWNMQRVADDAAATTPKDYQPGNPYDERYKKARAESLEIDVAEKLKLFVRATDVEQRWGHALTILNTSLQSLPPSLPMRLLGRSEADMEAIIEEAIRGALEQCTAAYDAAGDDEGDTDD